MYKTHPINWLTVGVMATFHALAIAAFFTPFKLHYLAVGVGIYVWMGLATTLYLHRGLTHRAFETTGWIKFLLCLGSAVGQQGDPVTWVGHHRWHHAKSDRPGEDVHSPKDGFWYSHFEWIFRATGETDATMRNLAKDIRERYWYARLAENPVLYILPHLAMAALLYATMGLGGMLWGLYVPMVVIYHATWAVNSVCHTPGVGYRTTETHEQSRNFWLIGLLGLGEGWHNNHHACQTRAPMGQTWYEIDVATYVLWLLERVGLAWDVRWHAPQRAIDVQPTEALA